MYKRKNIGIARLVEIVNKRNVESHCSREVRMGWNSLLEVVLHETGNYHGFGYLSNRDLPGQVTPGIRYEKGPDGFYHPCDDYTERFRDTDDSRIFFYH